MHCISKVIQNIFKHYLSRCKRLDNVMLLPAQLSLKNIQTFQYIYLKSKKRDNTYNQYCGIESTKLDKHGRCMSTSIPHWL